MYILSVSKGFQKELEGLVKRNQRLRSKVTKTLILLKKNPKHPSLRLHKVSHSSWSVSVTMRSRIVLITKGNKIYLLRIGTHDEVY